MRCIHRAFLASCTRCQVRANMRKYVPGPETEWERVARRVEQMRDAEGEGYNAGGLCICVQVTDCGITEMTGCPVHGTDAA